MLHFLQKQDSHIVAQLSVFLKFERLEGQLLGQQHARLLRDPLPLQRSHDGSHPDDDSDAELGCHRASPAFGHRRSVPSVHVHRGSGRALHSHRPAIPCKFREAPALQEVLKSGRDHFWPGFGSLIKGDPSRHSRLAPVYRRMYRPDPSDLV